MAEGHLRAGQVPRGVGFGAGLAVSQRDAKPVGESVLGALLRAGQGCRNHSAVEDSLLRSRVQAPDPAASPGGFGKRFADRSFEFGLGHRRPVCAGQDSAPALVEDLDRVSRQPGDGFQARIIRRKDRPRRIALLLHHQPERLPLRPFGLSGLTAAGHAGCQDHRQREYTHTCNPPRMPYPAKEALHNQYLQFQIPYWYTPATPARSPSSPKGKTHSLRGRRRVFACYYLPSWMELLSVTCITGIRSRGAA